jgi:hypothetical protein
MALRCIQYAPRMTVGYLVTPGWGDVPVMHHALTALLAGPPAGTPRPPPPPAMSLQDHPFMATYAVHPYAVSHLLVTSACAGNPNGHFAGPALFPMWALMVQQ